MPRPGRLALLPSLLSLAPSLLGTGCGLDSFVDSELGDAPRCAEVDRWPVASADAEDELLDALEELRQAGAECEGEVVDGVGPLEPIPTLQCAARLHAGDLVRHPEHALGHEGTDGRSALARVNAAGYDGIARHELLAGDYAAADALVEAWRGNEAHCKAVLDRDLDHVGVAQAQSPTGDRIVWVVVTGQERG
ncbi:CAP domain-containing protein [Paraliomyxa miuraensis]|uniref:CAP domain-containing protein n=1 Tax=Paraliomyxa miuraensis TaxID=376150 RepID=UPI0022527521|nr:CAP domain-containing protein [Paraliomyxa miuraensis]MCX4241088.1 CAP domain-containing protein [Paraliomyxa miuraensis]